MYIYIDWLYSQQELETLLIDMGIKFSRKNWDLLYRKINRRSVTGVTLDELMMFVFPENEVIRHEEAVRIKKLQTRIRKQTVEFARIYDPHSHFPKLLNMSRGSLNDK